MKDRGRTRSHVEYLHHERWLVSYADFMTLLFALFVVLFASSHHDRKSIERVSSAVKDGFAEIAEARNAPVVDVNAGKDTAELQRKLAEAFGKEMQQQEIVTRKTSEGLVISLHEMGFFSSGEATLLPGAADKVKRLATVLMESGMDMRVEGHTDDVPIHTAAFHSNWELSVARAESVSMLLLSDASFDPRRLAIAGYGEYHPAQSNDTAAGRQANRRVDVVVISNRPHANVP